MGRIEKKLVCFPFSVSVPSLNSFHSFFLTTFQPSPQALLEFASQRRVLSGWATFMKRTLSLSLRTCRTRRGSICTLGFGWVRLYLPIFDLSLGRYSFS